MIDTGAPPPASTDTGRAYLEKALRYISGAPRHLARWRASRRASPAWTVVVSAILFVVILPIVAILAIATSPADNAWPHLARTVLPEALAATFWLAVGTGALTLVVGTGTAWL